MSILREFKSFAMRGNVLDMAIGVIVGVSFGKIVTSLVKDVIMPPIGLALGGVDFSSLKIYLDGSNEAAISYGAFINTIIDFLIVAFVIFLLVKAINTFKKADHAMAVTTKDCPECLLTIPKNAKRCGHCTSMLT